MLCHKSYTLKLSLIRLVAKQLVASSFETWTVFGIGCTSLFDLNGMTFSCISPGTEQGTDYNSRDHGPSLPCPLPCQHLPTTVTSSFGLLIPAGQCGGSELGNIATAYIPPLSCSLVESLIASQNMSILISITLGIYVSMQI